MLFNSYTFILLFLPITVGVFFALGRIRHALAAGWMVAASLFFYAWWNPTYLGLLLGSILFNFTMGRGIAQAHTAGAGRAARRRLVLAVGCNLALLGYYKYMNFFVANIDALTGSSPHHLEILLPLGISFFTFTQIAFLVDTFQGKVKEYKFVHYALFVTYFPHLIAGPILHHAEMMPQFAERRIYRPSTRYLAAGLTMFCIGLCKKVLIADEIAVYVAPVFGAAAAGHAPGPVDAWLGALAYTLQLYFDFSGYSDMAIGLSKMIGVRLPLNFASPYKAVNIIEFWRRWHMTLSRFLRDYLYFPLGGNRRGTTRRYLNLLVTMLLGGLWHGAGWTFIVWGALHGFFLAVNHGWQTLLGRIGRGATPPSASGRFAARVLTFLAVVVAWVFFRASDVASAVGMLRAMAGFDGLALPQEWLGALGDTGRWLAAHGVQFSDSVGRGGARQFLLTAVLLGIVWMAPNSQEIMARARPGLGGPLPGTGEAGAWWQWKVDRRWAIATALCAAMALASLNRVSEFIYFQF